MLDMNRLITMPRLYKDTVMVIHDTVALVISIYFSSWLTYGNYEVVFSKNIFGVLVIFVIAMSIFFSLGLYRSSVRYMGYKAMFSILQATILLSGILLCAKYLMKILGMETIFGGMELRELIVFWLFITFLLMGSRQVARWLLNSIGQTGKFSRYLIYGAGDAGRQAVSAIVGSADSMILGFIDDDHNLWGRQVNNYPVLGGLSDITLIAKKNRDVTVLLAAPSMNADQRKNILDFLEKKSIAVRTLPPLRELALGLARMDQIEPIRIEELLGRAPVNLEAENLTTGLNRKTILVTGAGGSIGSELCRQIITGSPKALLILDHSEFNLYRINSELLQLSEENGFEVQIIPILGSVLDRNVLIQTFELYPVEFVYHAAAYKHVHLVEGNIISGLENNVLGTYNIATLAYTHGVKSFVNVSTDKAVRPTNVMGATKRLAELVVQGIAEFVRNLPEDCVRDTKFTMVRFGNVLGSSGSVVPLFAQQIRDNDFVTVTHRDVTRYFMTVAEASQLIIETGFVSKGGEVFVLDMGEPVKIDDLAKRMIRLSGYKVRCEKRPEEKGTIEVRYTGLRPGEKLYEELCLSEGLLATQNPKIFQAHEEFLVWREVEAMVERVKLSVDERDQSAARSILQEFVVDYCPS